MSCDVLWCPVVIRVTTLIVFPLVVGIPIEVFLCISVLRVASGPKVKFASCKSALIPPVFFFFFFFFFFTLLTVLRRWSRC